VDASFAWSAHLPTMGDTCILTKTQVRSMLGILMGSTGLVIGIVGLVVLVAYGMGKSVGIVGQVSRRLPNERQAS